MLEHFYQQVAVVSHWAHFDSTFSSVLWVICSIVIGKLIVSLTQNAFYLPNWVASCYFRLSKLWKLFWTLILFFLYLQWLSALCHLKGLISSPCLVAFRKYWVILEAEQSPWTTSSISPFDSQPLITVLNTIFQQACTCLTLVYGNSLAFELLLLGTSPPHPSLHAESDYDFILHLFLGWIEAEQVECSVSWCSVCWVCVDIWWPWVVF